MFRFIRRTVMIFKILYVFYFVILFCGSGLASFVDAANMYIVDDFETGISDWSRCDIDYGDVRSVRHTVDKGNGSGSSLRIDYGFASKDLNHVVYARPFKGDLSQYESMTFDILSSGQTVNVMVFIWDSKERHNAYGEYRSDVGAWATRRVVFKSERILSRRHREDRFHVE